MGGHRYLGLTMCAFAAVALLGFDHSDSPGQPTPPEPGARKKRDPAAKEPPIVTVTPKAAATIKQLIADQPTADKLYLRIRVVPGGPHGFKHKLDLDPDVSTDDQVCETAGISVVIFKRQVEMLRGTQVDFGEENGKRGFKVDNPNFKGELAKKWLPILAKEKDIK